MAGPSKKPRADNGRNVRRIPRRLHVGRGYLIEIVLVTPSVFHDLDLCEPDEELDGAWQSLLGEGQAIAGRIYINARLPQARRWDTYWHELAHAVNDIMAWDRETPIATT